jgi:ZIP family zinc transporter
MWAGISIGVFASLVAGLGAGVGALGVLFIRRLSARTEDALISGAAGVMLAATFLSLLLPGIEHGVRLTGSEAFGVAAVVAGMLLGALVLRGVHELVPHEHFQAGPEGPEATALGRMWLFVIAITLHNFPEGLAVGTGFAEGDWDNGVALATGIGLQNVPEGLTVAVSLLAVGYGRLKAFWIGLLTGLVEPVGGLVGSALVTASLQLIPWAMGFAAGAMLFVISHEIIPETHRRGPAHHATFALLAGVGLMLVLDRLLV